MTRNFLFLFQVVVATLIFIGDANAQISTTNQAVPEVAKGCGWLTFYVKSCKEKGYSCTKGNYYITTIADLGWGRIDASSPRAYPPVRQSFFPRMNWDADKSVFEFKDGVCKTKEDIKFQVTEDWGLKIHTRYYLLIPKGTTLAPFSLKDQIVSTVEDAESNRIVYDVNYENP